MDAGTHALAGLCLARSLPRRLRGRDVTIVVTAASLVPDIDVVWALWQPATAALNRHLLTHSLLGAAILALGLGGLARLTAGRLSLAAYVLLAAAGALVHIGLDLINAFGVALFYPWSSQRFELPLAFILDPVLTGVLLGGLLVPWLARNPQLATLASRAALLLIVGYLAVCLVLRGAAETILQARAEAAASDSWAYLVPEPGAPLSWAGLFRNEEGYGRLLVHPLSGRTVALAAVRSSPHEPLVAAARATAEGRRAEAFLKAPVWRREGDIVLAYDLRFRFTALGNDWDPFGFCFLRQGDRFVLLELDLGTYLANWIGGVLKFGLSTDTRLAATTACPRASRAP